MILLSFPQVRVSKERPKGRRSRLVVPRIAEAALLAPHSPRNPCASFIYVSVSAQPCFLPMARPSPLSPPHLRQRQVPFLGVSTSPASIALRFSFFSHFNPDSSPIGLCASPIIARTSSVAGLFLSQPPDHSELALLEDLCHPSELEAL